MRDALRAAAVGAVLLTAAPRASAQAWVPPAGAGSVTVAAQRIDNTGHIDDREIAVPGGKSRDLSIYVEAEYAWSDRISFVAGIPFVFAKYEGPPPPNLPLLENDLCRCWQHGWQDFGFTARYNVLNGRTAITPSISYGLPSHDYGYQGEAVLGRHLREVRLALDVGRRLDAISPRLAAQASYAYAFVQRTLDVPNNRSNASATVSFEVVRSFSIQGGVTGQITHGGLRVFGLPSPPDGVPWGEITTPALLQQHDRLLRDDNWRAGGGATYHASRADVFFSYLAFAGGRNTHQGRTFTMGVSLPFQRAPPSD